MTDRTAKPSTNNGNPAPDFRIERLAPSARLAIRALAELARAPRRVVETAALAVRLRLPAASLSKCLQTLARRGILVARRGPGGGYRLAVAPAGVTLAAVVGALGDGQAYGSLCVMEDRRCAEGDPCRLHQAAASADGQIRSELERLTLEDLL